MFRISKGDITIEAETVGELRCAIDVLEAGPMQEPPNMLQAPVFPKLPDLPFAYHPVVGGGGAGIGGPVEGSPGGISFGGGYSPELGVSFVGEEKPALSVVPPAVQQIPVRHSLLMALEVLKHFPEGITSRGVGELLGVKTSVAGQRLCRLSKLELAEHVPHSLNWRMTDLARRAKLIAS